MTRGTERSLAFEWADQRGVGKMASRATLSLFAATVASAVIIYFVHGAQETERKVR